MLQVIRTTSSLARISKRSFCGQVATILILMMVAVLIFVLAIINLGKMSLTTTTLANAADSAALSLGSQLATKANGLWLALGEKTEKCKKGGLLSIILAIVFAIVAVIILIVSWGQAYPASYGLWLIAAGLVAGAIGGAIGAAFQGTNILTGALQGAIIGATIGAGAGMGVKLGIAYVGLNSVSQGVMVASSGITYLTAAAAAGAVVGAVVAVTITAGSAIYNASVADKMNSAAFAAAAKALSSLPEKYQYQEGVMLQALSQTVDDPNMETDSVDTDTDGDITEHVTAFQVWWYNRTSQYETVVNLMKSYTDAFKTSLKNGSYTFSWGPVSYGIPPFVSFYRQEVEDADGSVLAVLRSLEGAVAAGGGNLWVSFWDPGPTESQIDDWIKSCDVCETCEDCPNPPVGYDVVDDMMIDLQNFSDYSQAILDQDTSCLVNSYNSWIKNFYDPDEEGDYYGQLQTIKNNLTNWSLEIESLRTKLPKCMGWQWTGYSNPPCQKNSFGTIDEDLDDEFSAAQVDISSAIKRIDTVLYAILNYYNNMETAMTDLLGGLNPAEYEWNDSIGTHFVEVEVGDFTVPYIKTKKSGFLKSKICLILKNYSGSVSVSITKTDPSDVNIGVLGAWNRSAGTITRSSTASYNGACNKHGGCYVKLTGK